MNVFTSTDRNYLLPTQTMFESLFRNTKSDITVYLMHSSLHKEDMDRLHNYVDNWSKKNLCRFERKVVEVKISQNAFEKFPLCMSYTTIETYYRLQMNKVLPTGLDRILYLDGDIIVNRDLTLLYNTEFDGMLAIACRDYNVQRKYNNAKRIGLSDKRNYFNAGVVLFDLPRARPIVSMANIEMILNKYQRLLFQDQDILNILLDGKVKYVKSELYNYMMAVGYLYSEQYIGREYIYHYAGGKGVKPWRNDCMLQGYDTLYWKYSRAVTGLIPYIKYRLFNGVYRIWNYMGGE